MSELVRQTVEEVARHARHVKIKEEAIDELLSSESTGFSTDFVNSLSKVQWDACDWHYCADAVTGGPLTALYVLVLDALNFCFWPTPRLEYEHLAVGLKTALITNPESFSASALRTVSKVSLLQCIQALISVPDLVVLLAEYHPELDPGMGNPFAI